jgi:hypothetical protein
VGFEIQFLFLPTIDPGVEWGIGRHASHADCPQVVEARVQVRYRTAAAAPYPGFTRPHTLTLVTKKKVKVKVLMTSI